MAAQSVKLFAGNNVGGCRKDLVFLDFVSLCGGYKSKKSRSHRRKVGPGEYSRNLLVFRKNCGSSVKSVLDVERVHNALRRASDPKPKDFYGDRDADSINFTLFLTEFVPHKFGFYVSVSRLSCYVVKSQQSYSFFTCGFRTFLLFPVKYMSLNI